MNICKVVIFLNKEKAEFKEYLFKVLEETEKTFKVRKKTHPFNRRFNKKDLLKVNYVLKNSIYNDSPILSYFTYCKEEDIEEAKRELKKVLIERFFELNDGFFGLVSNINKFINDEEE